MNDKVESIIKIASTGVAVGTLLLGIFTYHCNASKDRRLHKWKLQLDLYTEVLDAAGRVAAGHESPPGQSSDRDKLRQFDGTQMALIGSTEMQKALRSFVLIMNVCDLCGTEEYKKESEAWQSECAGANRMPGTELSKLQKQNDHLATCARLSLEETWELGFEGSMNESAPQSAKCISLTPPITIPSQIGPETNPNCRIKSGTATE